MCDEEDLAKSETSFASNLLMQTVFWFIFKKIIFLAQSAQIQLEPVSTAAFKQQQNMIQSWSGRHVKINMTFFLNNATKQIVNQISHRFWVDLKRKNVLREKESNFRLWKCLRVAHETQKNHVMP